MLTGKDRLGPGLWQAGLCSLAQLGGLRGAAQQSQTTSSGKREEKILPHHGGDLKVLELGGYSGSLPIFINKVLLAHSHVHSLRCCPLLFSCLSDRVE